MSSNKLEKVKCEKFTNKCVPNKHTEKSVYFLVTTILRSGDRPYRYCV